MTRRAFTSRLRVMSAVYYQQYEIAPYASGIPVFEIPYADLGIEKPNCG